MSYQYLPMDPGGGGGSLLMSPFLPVTGCWQAQSCEGLLTVITIDFKLFNCTLNRKYVSYKRKTSKIITQSIHFLRLNLDQKLNAFRTDIFVHSCGSNT